MLKITDLFFKYNKNDYIIKKLNLTVNNNIVSILGRSGCGKSTLLRIICGFIEPEKGIITLNNKNILNEKVEKRGVGMLFQNYALFPHLNVRDNIAFSLKNKNDEIVDELLEIIELKDHRNKYTYNLSGGEKQRVALARALAHKPKIILLDEPFSNIDTNLKESLRKRVKDILSHYKMEAIMVTHDYEDAIYLSDEIYYMKDGILELENSN